MSTSSYNATNAQPNPQQQQQQPPTSTPLPALRNCLDIAFVDDTVRLLCHFLCATAATQHLEIEARLGLLWSHANNVRYRLPHSGEQTLAVDSLLSKEYRFVSEISPKMCQHVNERLLKPRFQNAQAQHKLNPHLHSDNATANITYSHPVLIDKFYPHPTDKSTLASDVRVSLDQKTGAVVSCITKSKTNIAVLPGIQPNGDASAASQLDFSTGLQTGGLDFRISAKIEQPVQHALIQKQLSMQQCVCHLIRLKDRMSYNFDSLLSVDVTKVTTWKQFAKDDFEMHAINTRTPPLDKGTTTYEIELELLDYAMIRREARKHAQGQPSGIPQLAQWYYENIRTLAKYAMPKVQPPQSCQVDQRQQQQLYAKEQAKRKSSQTNGANATAAPEAAASANEVQSQRTDAHSSSQSPRAAAKKAKTSE